jgi:ELWxxDGT repeat protein
MPLTYFSELNNGNYSLWVTDGTVAGSHMVRLFANNAIGQLTMIGGRVYFSVNDGVHGDELWTSDGTAAATVMVDNISPGAGSSGPTNLTNVDGTLFFAANDGVHAIELWKSDGTPAGTVMVKDIDVGAGSSSPQGLTNVNGTVFFDATDGTHGYELWKSDGTAAGTVMVKDIDAGAGSSSPQGLTNINGTLLFAANDGTHGFELWKSDGTAAGTTMVMDINPGAGSSINLAMPNAFVSVNGTLFFDANDGTHGGELWRSDGTAAGTAMVKDIWPGANGSFPQAMTNVDGTLFFAAEDPTHGFEVWTSDGTAAGTVLVASAVPYQINLNFPLVNVNGTVFFDATDGTHGYELWKSDGTAAGTGMVKDINPGAGNSFPTQLTNVNGTLEFDAFDGTTVGLFRSDGTAAGTVEIATNVGGPIGFAPQPVVNDMNGDAHSDILWRNSNGTLADWLMNGGSITTSGALTSGGAAVTPGPTWSVAGISDFNGDGNADVLWRNSADGTLTDWTMNGTTITSSTILDAGGAAVTPGASWSVIGTGDFDGDTRADILWRNTDGTIIEWSMNGGSILSSGTVSFAGAGLMVDASWSVAGIGDFNGDNRRDVLWRNSTDGTLEEWTMNGATVTSSAVVMAGAVTPDASWSVAGIGDFNGDGNSDVLWRNSNGSLSEWLMNGSTIVSSGSVTSGGIAVEPGASWHIVEVGDFNGDGQSDILWRNDNGTMAEWLMSGTTIMQSVTPNAGGSAISPDSTWSTQAKPSNFG